MGFGLFKRNKLTDNVPVTLTASGKQKADNMEGEGPKFMVLQALSEDGGVATIREVAESSRMSPDKVVAVIKQLIKAGYVQVQRQGGE